MTARQEPTTYDESASMETMVQRLSLHEPSELSLELITREIRNAIQAQHYAEAIVRASTWTSKLPTLTAEIVELRALAYEKTANIANELEDALSLTKMSPKDANGYLRAAKLYAIQGKQQQAIDVLESGKRACTSKSNHALLQQQIDQAADRLRRRVDFIAQAPYDILCNILSHFTFAHTLIVCFEVSTTWMRNILRCPSAWRSIEISQELFRGTKRELSTGLLPYISRHVQRLKMVIPSMSIVELLGIISLGTFTNLRVLDIETSDPSEDQVGLTESLFFVLPALSQTLTEIKLCYVTSVSLGRLLTQCPNLTSISCGANQVTGVSNDFPVQHTTSLTSICLRSEFSVMTTTELAPIIQHSPRLQILQLYRLRGNVLPILGQHCPELKVIETDISFCSSMDPYYFMYDPEDYGNLSSSGLEVLVLTCVSSVQPLQSLLKQSADSLQHIRFDRIAVGDNPRTDWEPLYTTSFHRLTFLELDLNGCPDIFREQLPAMLRCYPALERLQLQNWYNRLTDIENTVPSAIIHRIFDAIADLNYLEELVLESFDVRSQSFTPLLERYTIQQEGRALLHELDISRSYGLTVANMHQISRIQSLTSLSVGSPEGVTAADATDFFRQVSQFPDLDELRIVGFEITTEAAQCLDCSRRGEGRLSLVTFHTTMSPEAFKLLKNGHVSTYTHNTRISA